MNAIEAIKQTACNAHRQLMASQQVYALYVMDEGGPVRWDTSSDQEALQERADRFQLQGQRAWVVTEGLG